MRVSVAPSYQANTPQPLLLRAKALATLLGVSERTIHSWRASGRLPPANKIAGTVVWRRSDIDAWIAWNFPSVEQFIRMQEKTRNEKAG